ncbi:MAG TPA: LytTR family transcriptional regulator, partial [Rhodanobacter sp.]|nr:LytTR family transcriptional regulator [Rhodanobacter sp.]
MSEPMAAGHSGPQRWRPAAIGFWLLVVALNTVFNGVDAQLEHSQLPAWMPWSWECSSALLVLALLPAVVAFERRWPLHLDDCPRRLPRHLAASVVFSLIHVGGMVGLRKLAYAAAGQHYDFGAWWINFGYEYLKDVRTYA